RRHARGDVRPAHRVLQARGRHRRGRGGLSRAVRPDGPAAQPEGARHIRLPGRGAGQSGLCPVRAAHARLRAPRPLDTSAFWQPARPAGRQSPGAGVMPVSMPFGLSTHLFHGERLERDHLARMAARDFGLVEVFATRTHVDYHDARRVEEVRGWLDDLHLTAWSIHAPITEGFSGGVWGRAYSNASRDAVVRAEAISEPLAAIAAARTLAPRHGAPP